jgi:N-acetylmuramoyl-L-alanine amidase
MLKKVLGSLIIGSIIISLGFMQSHLKPRNDIFSNTYLLSFTKASHQEIECLANNIFFEAAYEPEKGKKAVAFVTMNRVNSSLFPNNICDVVKQKTTRVCQFSWYCEENPRRLSYTKELTTGQQRVYNEIYELAKYVYVNHDIMKDPTNGALFYHADYVNPKWKNMIRTTTIGRHIFYVRENI